MIRSRRRRAGDNWLCRYALRAATHRSGARESVQGYCNHKGDDRKGDWQFHEGRAITTAQHQNQRILRALVAQTLAETARATSAPRDSRRYDANVLNKILPPPINPTPSEKLFRT